MGPWLTGWPPWAVAWLAGVVDGLFFPHSAPPTDLQEGHYAIPGDGLQQAWRPREALQPSPTGGEEGSDDNDPGGRPGQCAHHQIAIHSFAKPGMKGQEMPGEQCHLDFQGTSPTPTSGPAVCPPQD